MVLAFLRAEIKSPRFRKKLLLCTHGEPFSVDDLITNPDLANAQQNASRRSVLRCHRGYGDNTKFFPGFPMDGIIRWVFWHDGFKDDGRPGAAPNREYGRAWIRACRRAKVADLHIHDLRRGAARNLVRAGVNEKVAMALLGHRTRSIFDRYHIVDDRDLRDAVQHLADAATTPRRRHGAPTAKEA